MASYIVEPIHDNIIILRYRPNIIKVFIAQKTHPRCVCGCVPVSFWFDQLKSLKLFRVSMVVTMTLTLLTMELLAENTRAT